MQLPVIIIGSGMAGYGLARELRKLDADIPILIITRDAGDAYSKPMLSTALSQGKSALDLVSADRDKMAQDLQATILADTEVIAIDSALQRVVTDRGNYHYHKLVLALGAEAIRPSLQGDASDQLFSINHLRDYAQFREQLERAQRIVIIGSGLVGCEFAHDLAGQQRYQVTIVGSSSLPLTPLLPTQAALALQNSLSALGVQWLLACTAQALRQGAGGLELTLDTGERLMADLVLSAVGLQSNTAIAAAAGIEVRRGIVVDSMLQTSIPSIYALGDCAEIDGRILPYVLPIIHSYRALASTLAGLPAAVAFPAMPITIKTPSYAVVVLAPPMALAGDWELLEQQDGLKMIFKDAHGSVRGFVLTQAKTAQRNAMLAAMAG